MCTAILSKKIQDLMIYLFVNLKVLNEKIIHLNKATSTDIRIDKITRYTARNTSTR
jgi:hypothetical protein